MDEEIANKIKIIRKSNKISQEKLAEILDVSRSKVSNWERCKRDMSMTDAINLVNYFNLSLDNLFNINSLNQEQYIQISNSFFRNNKFSLNEKDKVVDIINSNYRKNNIDKIYAVYKMTQNDTK